jgi:hypothetical protein
VRIAGPLIESLKVLLMQNFQTAASVLKHRLPHSAKPHPRILPQRGISMKERQWKTNPLSFFVASTRLPQERSKAPSYSKSVITL